MPDSRDFDVQWLSNLRLPYDVTTKELSDTEPRLVAGSQNVYVTLGGKISIAPGFNETAGSQSLSGLALASASFRPDRLVIYETLESPVKVYLITSQMNFSTGFWEAYYCRIDSGLIAWTKVDGGANLRSVQQSTRPHEIVVDRGLCFIKAFPNAGGDKYGSVIFDGSIPNPGSNSAPSIYPWGIIPPTLSAFTQSLPWPSSTNPVTVIFYWVYTYAWKDLLGNYSCHAPVVITPGQLGNANTTPFVNLCPKVALQGNADTVNLPKVGVFRSTDGGGTYYFLEDVTNPGAGSFIYTDQHSPLGGTNPFPDASLNTFNVAPDLVTNLPPPPIRGAVGQVTGVSQVDPSTSIAVFARRLWYGAGNRLFFSGQEEVLNGVPEECWPNCNGLGPATQYLLAGQTRQVIKAKSALWITTANEILYETGTDLSNFLLNDAVNDIAGLAGNNLAGTSINDTAFFVSQDFQVYRLRLGVEPENISLPLGNAIKVAYAACVAPQIELECYNRDGNTWLIVNVLDQSTTSNGKQYVFDLNNNMWFAPWNKQLGPMAYGRLRDNDPSNYLIGAINYSDAHWHFGVLDQTATADIGGLQGIAPVIQTNLFSLAAGWGAHTSLINAPAVMPVVAYLVLERTKFGGDSDPGVSYRLDEFATVPFTSVAPFGPLFETQRTSYSWLFYPIEIAARRVQINIAPPTNTPSEMQNIGFIFNPTAGA